LRLARLERGHQQLEWQWLELAALPGCRGVEGT
jgi:hypothetical protein